MTCSLSTSNLLTCAFLTCILQNVVSKMKRDMKQLEDQAAASARSAKIEREHSLELEKDLQILAAELETVKKESAEAKKAAQKAHSDLKAVFDVCQKGIKAMCHHIFGNLLHLHSVFQIGRAHV